MAVFSGSYPADAVTFLLKPMRMPDTPVRLKEHLIQSGQKHYAELLTRETLPSAAYVQLFHDALALNQERLALDLWALASKIKATRPHGITLVSLLRAGTPVGVLLKHILQRYFQVEVAHYSVSILRDLGLDQNALRYILQRHRLETLVFVDAWTAKGVIARQLADSLRVFAAQEGIDVPAELYVLADLSGSAAVAATTEDYLIPSCLLNATVSGLVSRSVYADERAAAAGDFHGCVYYEEFKAHDLSNYFIDTLLQQIDQLWQSAQLPNEIEALNFQGEQMPHLLTDLAQRYGLSHLNYLKPGIGEATRVLLRRQPRLLLLQSAQADATRHLRWLAASCSVPVEIVPTLPYQAVALIQEVL